MKFVCPNIRIQHNYKDSGIKSIKCCHLEKGGCLKQPLLILGATFFGIVVSIEFSPLSTVELTTNWYQLHNGDYKEILEHMLYLKNVINFNIDPINVLYSEKMLYFNLDPISLTL